ncbi:MAG: sulfatase [Planctomycetales bacterium]|nr:sulfatase [Planctomycetales bacterium]
MTSPTHFRQIVFVVAVWSLLFARGYAEQPNVLFIAVDDLRPELGCYGKPALTPNIDRLAQQGLQFDRAYCNQAVCGASRLSLMSGLYPEYTGERTYHVTGWRERWPNVVTLNQHFKNNGYVTVGLGKVFHGSGGPGVDPDNWTEWLKVPGQEYSDPASLAAKRNATSARDGSQRGPATESADVGDDSHFDGNRAAIGAAQIRALAQGDQPFFLAVGFTKPHLPFVAPKKYWDLYQRDTFALPDNRGFPPGYPLYARNRDAGELRQYSDIPNEGTPADFPNELNQRLIHGYYACVSYLDRNVGVLLDALQEANVVDNTIVVFWADHGWKLGDHSSWCKHTNFECDTRVPLIIRHPSLLTAAGRTGALVELIDLYPTLCDLCGLERPEHLQGTSLLPVLDDPTKSVREFAYSSYPHGAGQGIGRVTGHSIRTAQYRYTEWWDKGDQVIDAVLSDIEVDPGEVTAVEGDATLKSRLSAILRGRVLAVRKR